MYSDTWPANLDFWNLLFVGITGRLGLFHFIQRMLRTLRSNHCDFHQATADLLDAVYSYHAGDMEGLLTSLKTGMLPANGKKYTDDESAEMQDTKVFRTCYSTYLRKNMRDNHTLRIKLDQWFVKYKVTASVNKRPAQGRLDPRTNQPLFIPDTKSAVDNCKINAQYLQDPLDIRDMYRELQPKPNSTSERGFPNICSFFRIPHHQLRGSRLFMLK